MRPDQIERICRLTPLQDGMFFEALRKDDSGETIYQICLELTGALSPPLLREAWRAVIRRHPILRTSFHYERLDLPVQVVHQNAEPAWQELGWRDVPRAEATQRLMALLTADRARRFELTRPPLMRLVLVRTDQDVWWLVWSYHHLLLDGWSTYLVLDDVFDWYRELSAGRLPQRSAPRPFWEYIAWTQAQDLERAERFWHDRLAGVTSPTPLGSDAVDHQSAETATSFDEVLRTLPAEVYARLETLARSRRLTLGTVVQAAWALTLSRYCGRSDVVFGSVVSGRPPEFAGVDDMVGLFINVLPIRAWIDEDRSLAEWLADLQADLADGREHDYTPLAHIQRWSDVHRGVPLFESIVVFVNYPVRPTWTDGGTVQVTDLRVIQQPHYPLHLTVVPDGRTLRMTLGYEPARFRRDTAEQLCGLVADALHTAATEPEVRIGDLLARLPDVGSGARHSGTERSLGELFAAQVQRQPDAPAVICGDQQLTYRQLDRRAGSVAHRLRHLGVGPDIPVAVCLNPSAELPVGLLAVLKAGGTILPLDPADPSEWISAALAATGASVAVTAGKAAVRFPSGAGLHVVRLDAMATTESVAGPGDQPGAAAPAHRALLGHGGTEPAATLWRHDETARLVVWLREQLALSPADRVLLASPTGSAESVRDTFWALSAGAVLVAPSDGYPSGHVPANLLARQDVTVAVVPSSLVGPLAADRDLERCRSLRLVICAPDPVPPAARLGICCTTGASVVQEYRSADPVSGSSFWQAATGDLMCVPGAARQRTHARVLPSQTGVDAAPAGAADGRLMWAVEAVLAEHTAVRDVTAHLVAVRSGEPTLTAYVVPAQDPARGAAGTGLDPADLASSLARRLPPHLVPQQYVLLEAMPVTLGGNVDRAALPIPGMDHHAREDFTDTLSSRAVTDVVAGIWAQAFELDGHQFGAEDNFFNLGGHSLLAIKLVSRIRSALAVEFTLHDLFADPTVAGTARRVRAALLVGCDPEPDSAIARVARTGPLPASFAQERLWILDRLGGASTFDNILLPCRLRATLDLLAFRAALDALVRRHEVLRTCLRERDGRPMQVVQESVVVPLEVSDLSHLPLPEAERRARELLEDDASRCFDPAVAPLFRTRVIKLGSSDHVIGLCLHHLTIDGWSTGVLFRDLSAFYQAFETGQAVALPPLAVQYADFAVWQRERLAGERLAGLLNYWVEHLSGAPEVLQLSPNKPRPVARSYVGGRYDTDIPPDMMRVLRALVSQESSTPFMILFAAFGVLVARYADRRDIVIGVPVAARSHPDLEGLVGFFVNTLPVRLDLHGEPTVRELLRQVRRACLGAFVHEELPFEKLVSELRPGRSTDRFPLVQVAFNFQNVPFVPLRLAGAEATLFETGHEVARFDLVAELYEWQGGVHCMFHYTADLFEPAFIRQFADEYLDLVRRFVEEPDGPVFGTADPTVEAQQALDTASVSRLRALQRQG